MEKKNRLVWPPSDEQWRWIQMVGIAIAAVYVSVVVWGVVDTPGPGTLRMEGEEGRRFAATLPDGQSHPGVDEATRQEIFEGYLKGREDWRKAALHWADEWSQHDDFAYHVMEHTLWAAKTFELHFSQVFMIYDEGIRKRWGKKPFKATWVPLKPRTQ